MISDVNDSLTSSNSSVVEHNYQLDITYTVFEVLVAIAAVIGNALVILVFWKEKKLRRRTKYYIISLAVADFLVGLVGIPFALLANAELPRNPHFCLFTTSFLVVLCTISIFSLVAVSVDRYWAILHPMSYARNVSSRTTIGIIIVCWVLGACVGFLPVMGWHNQSIPLDRPPKCKFEEIMDYSYLVFLYFATIIVPAIILAAFYAHIYTVILHQLRRIVRFCPGEQSSSRASGVMIRVLSAAQTREVKATQNLSIIVLFFIICWMPLYTLNTVNAFCEECKDKLPSYVTQFFIILSHFNSSCNPFLYAYHLKDFRKALRNLFRSDNEKKMFPVRTIKATNGVPKVKDMGVKSMSSPAFFPGNFSNLVFIDREEDEERRCMNDVQPVDNNSANSVRYKRNCVESEL